MLDINLLARRLAEALFGDSLRVFSLPPRDEPYTVHDYGDIELGDTLVRVPLKHHIVTSFEVSDIEQAQLSREALDTKYNESTILSFGMLYRDIVDNYVVSAPLDFAHGEETLCAKYAESGLNVTVSSVHDGEVTTYKAEMLFGTFDI